MAALKATSSGDGATSTPCKLSSIKCERSPSGLLTFKPSFVALTGRALTILRAKGNGPLGGPFLLVTYRCCSSGRAALWDFYHPCRGPDSAGPVSGRRLVADRASDPALDSAGQVGFGSSCCFLSWEHRDNGSESAPFRKNKSGNPHCRHYVTFSRTYSGLHPSLIGYATTAYA
jgi:hypothetical protein